MKLLPKIPECVLTHPMPTPKGDIKMLAWCYVCLFTHVG